MSIKIYKGTEPEANKASENSMANLLAGNLVSYFEKSTTPYTIIKYPTIKNQSLFGSKPFYPDCIIASPNQIIVIDFKECGGRLLQPESREAIKNSKWKFLDENNHEQELKGGTHGNPYRQTVNYASGIEYCLNLNSDDKLISECIFFYGKEQNLNICRNASPKNFLITGVNYNFVEDIIAYLNVKRDKAYNLEKLLSSMSIEEEKNQKVIGPETLEELDKKEKELELIHQKQKENLQKIAILEQENLHLRNESEKQKNATDVAKLKQKVQQNNTDLEKAEKDLLEARKETLKAKNLRTQAKIEKQKTERQYSLTEMEKSREKQEEYHYLNVRNKRIFITIILALLVFFCTIVLVILYDSTSTPSSDNFPISNISSTTTPPENITTEPQPEDTPLETSDSETTSFTAPISKGPEEPSYTSPTTETSTEIPNSNTTPASLFSTATNPYITDGDTITVTINGAREEVRLIGVEAPEVQSPYRDAQCFGKEAKNYLYNLIIGKQLELEADTSQDDRDVYGRLLRYVYYNGELINHTLIYNGYTREYTYKYAYKYQQSFREAEEYAKRNQLGLWNPTNCPNN